MITYPLRYQKNIDTVVGMLGCLPSLSHLQESTLERIGNNTHLLQRNKRRPERKNILYSQGDEADRVYLIVDGSVRSYLHFRDGNSTMTGIAIKGNWLGLQEVFCGENPHPYFNEAIVRQDSQFIVFPTYNVIDLFGQIPEFNEIVVRELARGYAPLYAKIQISSPGKFDSSECSLINFLITFGLFIGSRDDSSGGMYIETTNTEIAQFIGRSRETVNIVLKRLEHQGLVRRGMGRIYIPDIDALVNQKIKIEDS